MLTSLYVLSLTILLTFLVLTLVDKCVTSMTKNKVQADVDTEQPPSVLEPIK